MNIAKPFIQRPVMTTLIILPMIVFGIFAYNLLSVSAIPFIEPPIIQVATSYPGASPDEMARLVAGPLERQFMLMQGIQYVTSENDYEQTTTVLQFHDDVDLNFAQIQTQNAIDKAMGQLPQDLPNPPTYTVANPSDTPIIFCAIYSDTIPAAELYNYGYTFLGQQIGTVEGVANIQTYGFPYAVRVQIDPQALAAKGISLQDVANAINNENPDQPTGKFYGPHASIVTQTNGQIFKASDYEDLIIKYQDGAPVRIKDIGVAIPSVQNDKQTFTWLVREQDGKYTENPVVVLAIFKQQKYNTVQICQNIEMLMTRLVKSLPASVKFVIPFSQAVFIQQAVGEVQLTLVIAFILVVIVVFVYLGKIRNSIIPLIALPITITGTFMIMYVMGYSIDIMSMSALTLGIGFLVDDAIVVLENIVRYVQMGETPYRASLKGTNQIIITVISISLCLAIVFLPLLFMSGEIGGIFHEFAAVILIAVLFSAFISISLTPMLCSRFVPPYSEDSKSRMEIISDKINEKLVSGYRKGLLWALSHKKLVFIFCGLNLVGSLYLFTILPKEFLPPDDLGAIQGFIQTQQGVSPERLEDYFNKLQNVVMQNKYVVTMVKILATPTDNQGLFFVNLVDADKRPDIWTIIRQINVKIKEEVIGARVFMKAFPLINLQIGNTTSGKANYQYILQGMDTDTVYQSATSFLTALRSRPELTNVSSDMLGAGPTLNVKLLRDEAHAYNNQNATDIENAFMYAYGETYISKINRPENMYYVILEAKDRYVESPQQLDLLYLGNKDNQVAMKSVIDTEIIPTQVEINHINTMTSVTISFDVGEGFALSDAVTAIEAVGAQMLPEGIIHGLAGNTAAFKQTFKQLSILLLIAIFVIYIILGILYENFLHPLTALSSLPVAGLGGLLTLLIFNQALSIYALIGFIMLIGIVMKNGILIIDFSLEEMRENKLSSHDAVVKASSVRFRPIIMTTLAAMMGSVPVALGIGGTVAHGRAPLGMVVVGGLIFSQVVTLFVIPCFFEVICQAQVYLTTRFKLFRDEAAEDEKTANVVQKQPEEN